MADQVNKTGKVDIKIQLADGVGQLVKLGEAEDMPNVEERSFWHNVPGDRHGGPQGPPIEVQWLGSIAIVTVDMSRWDPTVWDNVRKRKVNATGGTLLLTEVGTLMLESNPIRCLLESTTRPINFPTCIVREAIVFNMGTKYTTARLQFEAHRTPAGARANILYDSTITEYT